MQHSGNRVYLPNDALLSLAVLPSRVTEICLLPEIAGQELVEFDLRWTMICFVFKPFEMDSMK